MRDFFKSTFFKWALIILAAVCIIVGGIVGIKKLREKNGLVDGIDYDLITEEVSAEDYEALVAYDSRLATEEKNKIAYYYASDASNWNFVKKLKIATIPSEINGIPVKSAYWGDQNAEKLVVAEGIESIKFSSTQTLTEIDIPDSVANLAGLTYTGVQFELENGIYYYKNWAIYTDGVLSGTIEVREGTVGIGSACFWDSTADNVELPDSLQYISDCAFWNMRNLTEIDLKNTRYVGWSSFANCTNLTQVSHEGKIEKIGECAFLNSGIQSLDLSMCSLNNFCAYSFIRGGSYQRYDKDSGHWSYSNTSNSSVGDYGYFGKNAFRNSALQNITLPEGLTKIPEYCFDNSKLTELSVPATLKNIQNRAFGYCEQLTKVVFEGENSTLHLGESAFQSCLQLKSVKFEGANMTFDNAVFQWCQGLSDVCLPENLTYIPSSAFNGCIALRSLEIPEKVTTIGESAFMDCTALEIIDSPEDAYTSDENESSEDLRTTDKNALPKNLRTIDKNAFANCTALTTITLPNGLKTLGETAFTKCTALASIVLPDSVNTLGDGCFKDCTALLEVKLGSGIQTLPTECFSGTNLNRFTVEKTVKTICPNALNSNNMNFSMEFSNPQNWILVESAEAQTGNKLSAAELGEPQKAVELYRKHCGKYWKKAA